MSVKIPVQCVHYFSGNKRCTLFLGQLLYSCIHINNKKQTNYGHLLTETNVFQL